MGKIFSSIFGGSGSKQKSQNESQSTSQSQGGSWNDAYPDLSQKFDPYISNGVSGNNFLASMLGLNGSDEADDAFDKYKDTNGFKFIMDSGQKAINSNQAAKGIFNSGATGKALSTFGQNTGSSFLNSYLDRLLGMSNAGVQAGGLVGSVGQKSVNSSTSQSTATGTSSGSSYSKPGIGQFLGSMLSSAAASDPRLKLDITPIGENEGLTVYDFRYVWDEPGTVRRGYMADEVERLRPDALGPELPGGYKTVFYSRLPKIEG